MAARQALMKLSKKQLVKQCKKKKIKYKSNDTKSDLISMILMHDAKQSAVPARIPEISFTKISKNDYKRSQVKYDQARKLHSFTQQRISNVTVIELYQW